MAQHLDDAQQDAAFVRNFGLVLLGLALLGVVIFFLARRVYFYFEEEHPATAEAIAERIAPVGSLNTSGAAIALPGTAAPAEAAAPAAAAPVASSPGEAAYNKVCFVCHAQGIAGAPKIGDTAAWEPRVAQGNDTLYKHAIEGFQGQTGMMPPKGGATDLSDADVKAAVDFIVNALHPAAAAAPAATEAAPTANEAAPAAAASGKGKEVYDAVCFACHTPGAAGAPKFGDVAAWGPRIAQGMDVLHRHSIDGFMGQTGLMPPKGGRPDFADEDVKAAVDYMVENSK